MVHVLFLLFSILFSFHSLLLLLFHTESGFCRVSNYNVVFRFRKPVTVTITLFKASLAKLFLQLKQKHQVSMAFKLWREACSQSSQKQARSHICTSQMCIPILHWVNPMYDNMYIHTSMPAQTNLRPYSVSYNVPASQARLSRWTEHQICHWLLNRNS